jgi:hypothetical protein
MGTDHSDITALLDQLIASQRKRGGVHYPSKPTRALVQPRPPRNWTASMVFRMGVAAMALGSSAVAAELRMVPWTPGQGWETYMVAFCACTLLIVAGRPSR